MDSSVFPALWATLVQPLVRLLLALCFGLLIANVVEALRWTQPLARLSAPLIRLGHLGEAAGASFSLAFFSPSAANAMLSESHERGEMSLRELVLANLFNSLPSYIVHLPTMLFLLWPVLGFPALVYTGLTLGAAAARTLFTVALGRLLLPPVAGICVECRLKREPVTLQRACRTAWTRFRRRLPNLVLFTVPVYILMYVLQRYDVFRSLETWLSAHLPWMSLMRPEALGIVLLSLAAEIGASLSAAGSALHMGGLTSSEVILALLIGNVLSTPMRAIRHQFPAYAGYYKPGLALKLLVINQLLRATTMLCVALLYWWFAVANA
ncbi:MAG: hypothetical protein RRY20_03485 [Bilophila sp.]